MVAPCPFCRRWFKALGAGGLLGMLGGLLDPRRFTLAQHNDADGQRCKGSGVHVRIEHTNAAAPSYDARRLS